MASNKSSNKILFFLTILILVFSIFCTSFIIYETNKINKRPHVTGKASGLVRFCYNNQPILNISCLNYTWVDNEYYCRINATDPDGTLTFTSRFTQGTSLFNISSKGIINFTPEVDDMGAYAILINVTDGFNCSNSYEYGLLNLTILGNNTQPSINLSNCSSTIYQNQNFSCKVNATDPGSVALTLQLKFWF
jgi:hypothetical protein